jgi:hypothetical protein
MATDPNRALTDGSPALTVLMLSLGRLMVGRFVLGRMPLRGRRRG